MAVNQIQSIASRASASLERLRAVRARGAEIATDFRAAAQQLQDSGRHFPRDLLEAYIAWADESDEAVAEWADEEEFRAYLPAPDDFSTNLADWEAALTQFQQDRQAREQQRLAAYEERLRLTANILDLACVNGVSPGLTLAQERAQALHEDLIAAAQDFDSFNPEQDGEPYHVLRALYQLARDAQQDSGNEETLIEFGELLQGEFGIELVMRACQGKLLPRSGWPVDAPAASAVEDTAIEDELIEPTGSVAGDRLDVLDGEEAARLLKLGQETPASFQPTPEPREDTPQVDPAELQTIRARVQSSRDRSRNAADSTGDDNHVQSADCFDALEAAIGGVQAVLGEQPAQESTAKQTKWRQRMQEALQSMATAQSALRQLHVERGWAECIEQKDAFQWLKAATDSLSIFLPRHMTLDDPADPRQVVELKQQIDERTYLWERPRRIQKLGSKIQHELGRITGNVDADQPHWHTVFATVEQLLDQEQVPPSNRDLRELLLKKLNQLPGSLDVPASFATVLREVDRYLADQEEQQAQAAGDGLPHRSPIVEQVLPLVRGRRLLMIGGEPREESRRRIQRTLELAEFEWLEAREHEPKERLLQAVSRPDVDLVCVLVRWCGHGHVDSINTACRDMNKPCVVMPAGYGVNHIAHDICQQVSDRLTPQ